MKQVIAAALVLVSGSVMASGISQGNVDLDGWVVEQHPAAISTTVSGRSGDLAGAVKEPLSAKGANGDGHLLGRGNVDLDGWIVGDVAGN